MDFHICCSRMIAIGKRMQWFRRMGLYRFFVKSFMNDFSVLYAEFDAARRDWKHAHVDRVEGLFATAFEVLEDDALRFAYCRLHQHNN